MKRWIVIGVLVIGAALRAAALPLPGTIDVTSWKIWSFAGSTDPAGMYGVGGTPPQRRVLKWSGGATTVDYPPLALYELAIVGRVYLGHRPALSRLTGPHRARQSAWHPCRNLLRRRAADVGAPPLWGGGGVGGAGVLDQPRRHHERCRPGISRRADGRAGGARAACGVRAPAGCGGRVRRVRGPHEGSGDIRAAVDRGRTVSSARIEPRRGACRSLGRVDRGARAAACRAPRRVGEHAAGRRPARGADMLSGNNLNAWWIVTWIVRALDSPELGWIGALTAPVRILRITDFLRLYPDPRPLGTALVGASILWACWRSRRAASLGHTALLGGWCVYAYTMLATRVHENHLYLAVPFLIVAGGMDRTLRPLAWAVSVMAAINLYVCLRTRRRLAADRPGGAGPKSISRSGSRRLMSAFLCGRRVRCSMMHRARDSHWRSAVAQRTQRRKGWQRKPDGDRRRQPVARRSPTGAWVEPDPKLKHHSRRTVLVFLDHARPCARSAAPPARLADSAGFLCGPPPLCALCLAAKRQPPAPNTLDPRTGFS